MAAQPARRFVIRGRLKSFLLAKNASVSQAAPAGLIVKTGSIRLTKTMVAALLVSFAMMENFRKKVEESA